MKDMRNRCYRFENVEMDVQNLRVTVGSEIRPLEPKSFRLLLFLIENPGRALPKEEIMAVVWPDTFVSDNSLARAITQIRKALDDDPKAPRYIETVPSVGYRFVADCKEEIKELGEEITPAPPNEGMPPATAKRWLAGQRWLIAAAAAAVLLLVLAIVYFRGTSAPDGPEMRLEIDTPATNDPRSFALSPDGRQLAYVATVEGQSRLWVRQLASTKALPLAVTEGGAAYPFWSPDSRSIGFFSGGKLKRIDAGGGSQQTLADAKSARGGTWGEDGVILFSPNPTSPLFRVAATGGEAVAATKLDWSGSHRFAQFLPDGQHFLVYVEGTTENPGVGAGAIYLGSLNSKDLKRLTDAESSGLYLPPGWLLFVHAGVLVTQRLNIARGELSGNPVTVADSVLFDSSHARQFSVSATGLVAYRRGTPITQLSWFDRSGKALGTLAAPAEKDSGATAYPRISPDGRRVAVTRSVQERSDIWLMDETHAIRFTFLEAGGSGNCVWSPDGSKIVFKILRKGDSGFYVKASDGTGTESPVADKLPRGNYLDDWSPDGRFLLYHNQDANSPTGFDLLVVPLEGDRKPWAFLQTKFDEEWGRFSPDGRWLAYESNESGRQEVYIRPFAEPAAADIRTDSASQQWQISVAGGLFPAWSHDGQELYWIGPDSRMMAAKITVTGKTLQPSKPVALFQTHIAGGGLDVNTGGRQFDVSSDGRFLINTVLDSAATPITLLQNWRPK